MIPTYLPSNAQYYRAADIIAMKATCHPDDSDSRLGRPGFAGKKCGGDGDSGERCGEAQALIDISTHQSNRPSYG
jgi:hypothetical protein